MKSQPCKKCGHAKRHHYKTKLRDGGIWYGHCYYSPNEEWHGKREDCSCTGYVNDETQPEEDIWS